MTNRPTFSPWRTPWTQPVRKCMPPNTRASTDSAAACDRLVKLRSIVMLGGGVGLLTVRVQARASAIAMLSGANNCARFHTSVPAWGCRARMTRAVAFRFAPPAGQ